MVTKIIVSSSCSKDFKLSKNFNSIGGSTGYSLSMEYEPVKGISEMKMDKEIEALKDKLDGFIVDWINKDLKKQFNEADKLLNS